MKAIHSLRGIYNKLFYYHHDNFISYIEFKSNLFRKKAVIFCIMLLKITVNLLYYYKHINKHTTIILFLDKEEFKKNNPIIKTIIISSIFTFIYF